MCRYRLLRRYHFSTKGLVGLEALLFLARNERLSDSEYLACVDI